MSDEEEEFFDAQESMYGYLCTEYVTNTHSDDQPVNRIAPIVTAPSPPAVVALASPSTNTPEPTEDSKHMAPVPVMRREKSATFLSVPTGMRQRTGLFECE